jgi:hypothetical protein
MVKATMEEVFGIATVDDYALHHPPELSAVRLYARDGTGGPNPEDLRIDMRSKISSDWNKEVMKILLRAVSKRKRAKETWKDLPDRSDIYFMEIIQDQLERARTTWRKAQPRLLESGEIESLAAVEDRMIESREVSSKTRRANMRRISVGLPIP